MSDLGRREFLRRAGAGAVALAAAGPLGLGEAVAEPSGAATLDRRELRELRRLVRGRVVTPGDRHYRRIRRIYNRRFDGIDPPAVVEVAGTRDVRAVIDWANRHDVKLTARAGGHSYAGYSTTHRGVVVDVRRLRRIDVSNGARRATVAAGVPLIEMYAELAGKGMTVPGGTCPTVGVTGLALGGGMGMASRKLGLTCDNLTGLSIVTPDGRLRHVDGRHDRDLLWACRGGGGGNFGIVTSLTFATHPVSSASYFHVSWPWSQADQALDAWQRFAPGTSPALSSVLSLHTGSKQPKITGSGQFFGSEEQLRKLLGSLTAVDGVELTVGTEDYLDLMLRWAGCEGESVPACLAGERTAFFAKSDYASSPLDSRGRRRMLRAVEDGQQQGVTASIILDAYGGAVNRVRPDATAFVHRDQLYDIQYLARFTRGGRRRAADWAEDAHRLLRRHVSGESYQNYIDPRLKDWKRAYYGDNYERLVDVKTRYDPEDRLRFRQGIRPRG